MKKKEIFILLTAAAVSVSMLAGCGKKNDKDDENTNVNIVHRDQTQQGENAGNGEGQAPAKNYDVLLDERPEEERYQYSMDDLSLVDTVSGKMITLGMTKAELEKIAGAPQIEQPDFTVYDGVIVQYTEQETAGSLVVSGGMFKDTEQATRYKTVRGVAISTGFEDFVKAYGDQYNEKTGSGEGESAKETPSNAIRYFKVDGQKVEYLGTSLTEEMKAAGTENLYMQDFMFGRDSNQVVSMRVTSLALAGK